ncbi:MAG TPA: DUF1223 domain-containing protein [Stellaceae bacterium]|nr:DUF1223 domain-containing protein [Stellaceae bacterium]
MIKPPAVFAALCVVLAITPAFAAGRPVVVELFTSEGCSSCPPADALLARLATRPEVLALSFHVDYWDRLGWKDPFSSAAATGRQRHYAELLGLGNVYTPQLVVDGRWQAVGSDRSEVEQALNSARGMPMAVPVTLALDHSRVRIAIGATGGAAAGSVVLIGFDRRHVDAVSGGENDGRTLAHVDVVRGIAEVGRFDGKGGTIEAPIGWHADRLAVLVEADDGHVLGAAVADDAPL